jgi:hypothetical protein
MTDLAAETEWSDFDDPEKNPERHDWGSFETDAVNGSDQRNHETEEEEEENATEAEENDDDDDAKRRKVQEQIAKVIQSPVKRHAKLSALDQYRANLVLEAKRIHEKAQQELIKRKAKQEEEQRLQFEWNRQPWFLITKSSRSVLTMIVSFLPMIDQGLSCRICWAWKVSIRSNSKKLVELQKASLEEVKKDKERRIQQDLWLARAFNAQDLEEERQHQASIRAQKQAVKDAIAREEHAKCIAKVKEWNAKQKGMRDEIDERDQKRIIQHPPVQDERQQQNKIPRLQIKEWKADRKAVQVHLNVSFEMLETLETELRTCTDAKQQQELVQQIEFTRRALFG